MAYRYLQEITGKQIIPESGELLILSIEGELLMFFRCKYVTGLISRRYEHVAIWEHNRYSANYKL